MNYEESSRKINTLPPNSTIHEHNVTLKKPILKTLPIKNYDELNIDIYDNRGLYCYIGDGDDLGIFYSIPHSDGKHSVCGCRHTFHITHIEIKHIINL
jgi:hypothetical protein